MVGDLLNLIEYLSKAWLLLYFCKDSIMVKEKYRSAGKVLFFLQAFLTGYWLSASAWFNSLLYGNADGMVMDSSYSIIKLVIVLVCSFFVMDLFYQGKRLCKLYLLLVFYAVQEMVKFTLHSVWSLTMLGLIDHLSELVMAEEINLEQFMTITTFLQDYSMCVYLAGCLAFTYGTLRVYRHYLIVSGPVDEISRQGLWFLMLTPMVTMAFDVYWRISFYRQQGTEVEFLYEKHGSMYVMVPVIALLCLACIVFSRRIYSELVRTEMQKNDLLFYKQQLADMTDHVREMEQLYDGIRGMRHDVHNYVADMEQLLQIKEEHGMLHDAVRQEAGKYLAGMQNAVDDIFLQFSTGNPVTDVILNRKAQICRQEGIDFTGDFLYPAGFGIEAFDLGILLNNALDNAIEACLKVQENRRYINLKSYAKGRMFFLVAENGYDGKALREEGGVCHTTKDETQLHGIGMKNMRSCVERYYGTMEYEADKETFVLTLMLQSME